MIIYRSLIADQRLYALLFGKKSTFWGELKSWHYWTYKNIYLCARLRFLSLCEHFEATYVLKLADRNDHFIYVDDKHVTYQTWYVTCFSYFHTPFVSVTVYSVETSKQSNTVVFNVANWISWEKGVWACVCVCNCGNVCVIEWPRRCGKLVLKVFSDFRFWRQMNNSSPNRTETVLKNADKLVRRVGIDVLGSEIITDKETRLPRSTTAHYATETR